MPETVSGLGSTLRQTESFRTVLPEALRHLGIATLLDAPCGDFNWMVLVDLKGIEYIGVDNDESVLAIARKRAPHRDFRHLDIVNGPLPAADAVLCRDCIQHWPQAMILQFMRNVLTSRALWLLITTHRNSINEDCILGQFREVNLTAAPYNFPRPHIVLPDGPLADRAIGIWTDEQVSKSIDLLDSA